MIKKIATSILLLILFSCQTTRHIVPTIESERLDELSLNNPIVISIKDSRTEKKDSKEVLESIKVGLQHRYGNNIIFKPYFQKTEEGAISIKIDIKNLEANFGVRLIQYRTYYNQVLAVSSSVQSNWGSSVSTAIVSQSLFEDNFTASGYWIGTTRFDVSFIDNFSQDKEIYNFEFSAEDKKDNMWGYKSGTKAAKASWVEASSGLINFIDQIALKISELE